MQETKAEDQTSFPILVTQSSPYSATVCASPPTTLHHYAIFWLTEFEPILEGEETWYLREDVLKALDLKEAPRWNQHLFVRTQRTTAVWTDSEERTSRYRVISESGFYKLLCLGRLNEIRLTFNFEGGNLIYNMPGPGEGFDAEQREFFRDLLRSLHSNWLCYDAPVNGLDEWDLPA